MKVSISSYSNNQYTFCKHNDVLTEAKVQLVLGFGAKHLLAGDAMHSQLSRQYPQADIVLCSTSGEIFEDKVSDNSVSVTAIEFKKTAIKTASVNICDFNNDSFAAGASLVRQLQTTNQLCYIMILSDGGKVNGSELVNGVNSCVQNKVPVTGGLAGDGSSFISTTVGLNGEPVPGKIVAIAFYGTHFKVAHGSMGGWEMFGPERIVTKSIANELFEINSENALEVYKKYLGTYASELPGSALLFPLSVQLAAGSEPVVRTILQIDDEKKSMVFAGDVPEGSPVRFMKANFDKLIGAASEAALQSVEQTHTNPRLAILISCVGRRLILGSRTEEEVEAVYEAFGKSTLLTGFYSYGEIAPLTAKTKCELNNQTMTITTFDEI